MINYVWILPIEQQHSLGNGGIASTFLIPSGYMNGFEQKLTGNTHTQLNFGAIPYRNNEVMETHVNTSKLRALGWKPDTLLIDGLSKMIKLEREVKII